MSRAWASPLLSIVVISVGCDSPDPSPSGCDVGGCEAAPAPECLDGETLRVYADGRCVEGECVYEFVDESCPCVDGACVDESCEDVVCAPVPAAECLDDETLRIAGTPEGRCVEGECVYDVVDESCPCVDGACVDESCEVTGCEPIPRASCVDERALRIAGTPEGRCDDGVCVYDTTDFECELCEGGSCEALGEQHTAVILIDVARDGSAQDPDVIREAIFDGERSVARFVEEASYGRAWLTGDVYGWYPFESTTSYCELAHEDVLELAEGDVPFSEIDRFIVLFHAPDVTCDGLGVSTHGKVHVEIPGGEVIRASVSSAEISYRLARPTLPHAALADITATVIAHELGHGFGIHGHANLFECGGETLSSAQDACEQEAIADMFSLMSGEGFRRSSLHFGACHKMDIGWLRDDDVLTIDLDELEPEAVRTVRLFPFEELSAEGPISLRVILPTPIVVTTSVTPHVTISELFVENRTAMGFDAWLEQLVTMPDVVYPNMTSFDGTSDLSIDIHGPQLRGGFIRETDGHCVTTYLLDTHPDSLGYDGTDYSLYDALDGFLNLGEVFHDPINDFTVTTTAIHDDGSVELELRR